MTVNILFLLVCGLILFFIWKGYNRGLLGIIFGIVGWIFALYFIQTATPVIEQYLLNNPKVVQSIGTKVEKKLDEKVEDTVVSTEDMGPVEKMKELLEKNNKLAELENQTEQLFEEKKNQVISDAALVVTGYIIHAIATIAAIAVAFLIVSFVWNIIQFINHAPVIGGLSRFLGLVFGAAEGFLIVWILMYIISLVPDTNLGQLVQTQINENEFLLYLYENNILRLFFG